MLHKTSEPFSWNNLKQGISIYVNQMKGVNTMDYELKSKVPIITVLYKLYYNNELVGYRVAIRNVQYDMSLETFDLIQADFEPTIHQNLNNPPSPVNLIARGTQLVPEGLQTASEIEYSDFAELVGLKHMVQTDTELKRLYNKYNFEIFDDELPTLVGVEWSKTMHSGAGVCKTRRVNGELVFRIRLSVSYHELNPHEIMDTLVHEMIHVKHPRESHGYNFHREADRINRQHNMNIQVYAHGETKYKYLYTCTNCDQQYTRMRKLNLNRVVCGKCRSKLILMFEN